MSRIGKKPIAIPGGVTAIAEEGTLTVKGPKGTLTMAMLDDVIYKVGEAEISSKSASATISARICSVSAPAWPSRVA